MKKIAVILAMMTLLCISVLARGAENKNTVTDPNKAIQVTKKSPIIVLKIKSNPSTGYSWFLVNYDSTLITPISREFVPSEEKKTGSPGYELWRFSVNPTAFNVPRMTDIILQYIKPWVVPSKVRQLKFVIVIEEPKSLANGSSAKSK